METASIMAPENCARTRITWTRTDPDHHLLDIQKVFAGLLMVILLGLAVENFIFGTLEHRTVRRWGMQS
jgi:hypothetical protein